MKSSVTLQVSLAPNDLPHARLILPHQIGRWVGQVDEVLLTLDLHRSKGRFSEGWSERLPGMRSLIADMVTAHSKVRSEGVDYARRDEIGRTFFGGSMPEKDYRGGPFYSYFFGLSEAKHDLVFHIDSDMMFGGSSSTWIPEAVERLSGDVLTVSPLAGPPRHDGTIHQQAVPLGASAFRFDHMSTRLFLLDRRRLADLLGSPAPKVSGRDLIKARAEGNPPFCLPEQIISQAMRQAGLFRVDLLGRDGGTWSIHPPYRSATFYQGLGSLLRRIEVGDVPDEQRGHYDLNDSMVDWSEARARLRANRWWLKLLRR